MRLILFALALAAPAFSQTTPQFEVATVKPSSPDVQGTRINTEPGGRVTMSNFNLKDMITIAWQVQPYQVSGGPPWLESAHFDISTKADSNPKPGETPLMLQALLKERFQLVIRKETKELPIYAIVLAHKDGKLGPQLTESKCVPFDRDNPPPPPEPGTAPPLFCGGAQLGPAQMRMSGMQIADVAPMLSRMLGRTVIDKTGLTAKYDIKADWIPGGENQFANPPTGTERPALPDSGPSIFTALQEQLGLKLESQKGPVEVLVIEKAEKPTGN
jgi:uncharacterized protein (TIGR03435 family)